MSANSHLSDIVRNLREAQNILLATHVFPDGDALGSMLGFGEILEAMGKKVILYAEEPVSYLYDFLPCCQKVTQELPVAGEVDCAVALDCGDKYRLGKAMDELLDIHPFMVIDHHAGNKAFGDLRWVDGQMPSTGNMVYELTKALGVELSHKAAYCLYTAIVSDTGSFKYASTTPETFLVAGNLVAKGINPEDVAGKLFDNFTESRLKLLQQVLASLEIMADGSLGIITVTKDMYEATGSTSKDTETFINYPRSLASVKVAVFFKEAGETVSVSLRSKGSDYDVAEIAKNFGGGGHRNAAGFKVKNGDDLDKVKSDLLDILIPLLEG